MKAAAFVTKQKGSMIVQSDKQQDPKDPKKKNNVRSVIHVICIIGLLCCVTWLIWYIFSLYRSQKQMEELLQNYVVTPDTSEEASIPDSTPEPVESTEPTPEPNLFGKLSYPDLTDYEVPEIDIDFAGLKEVNPDVYAWIYVPDTNINYPILQHPNEAEYYLSRDINRNSSVGGCIFTQYYNNTDWKDNVTVVYGHNMGDRSMFATLHNYEDSQFFEEHPYVYIYTPEYTLVYQVFAAYKYWDRSLLLSNTFNDPETVELYLDQLMAGELAVDTLNANYNKDIELSADDRILVLSTCVKNEGSHRYLVHAKLTAVGNVSETAGTGETADDQNITGTEGL